MANCLLGLPLHEWLQWRTISLCRPKSFPQISMKMHGVRGSFSFLPLRRLVVNDDDELLRRRDPEPKPIAALIF